MYSAEIASIGKDAAEELHEWPFSPRGATIPVQFRQGVRSISQNAEETLQGSL